jgi:hypothetical protein
MRCLRRLALACVFAAALPAAADPNPDVWDYAKGCFERLHLDADDLKGPFDCTQGKRLVSTVDGVVQDRDKCSGASCATDIPTECDYGTWLDNGCYGHSYIQVVPTPSNPQVKAALLCRHKTRWGLGPAPLLDLEGNQISGFDDVAMIVHNRGNGETCWFQSPDGEEAHIDGTIVPGPATVKNHDFWIRPASARNIMCIKCHDSGPWMNSRWMNNTAGSDLAGDNGPYKNSEPPFDKWPQPKFVELADDDTCTSCHHIAASHKGVDSADSLGGPDFHTCDEWIQRATGRPHPLATTKGKTFEVTHWMPDGHGLGTEKEWNDTYRAKVDRIVACCQAVGSKPKNQWPTGCREETVTASCPVAESSDGSCPVAP